MAWSCSEDVRGQIAPTVIAWSNRGSKQGRPVGRWRDMIEADLKRRKVNSWYNIVQDRKKWRKIVHGEGTASTIRGERKVVKEIEQDVGVEIETGKDLTCPKCGKEYRARRSWYNKHVENCGKNAEGGWSCPKCGKHYKSKAGGWYQKHIDGCGSSRPSTNG